MAKRPYLKDRLIEDRPEGFVVIVPANAPDRIPLTCPVCDRVFRTRDDEAAYRKFSCCDRCAMIWAYPNRKAWETGWRPTGEQLEEAEANRPLLSLVFDAD